MKTLCEIKDDVQKIRSLIKTELVDNSINPNDLRMVVMQLDILDLFFIKENFNEEYKAMSPLDTFINECYEYIEYYKGEYYEKQRNTTND